MALRRTLLPLQDVSHRDDYNSKRADNLCIYRRALPRHLPPAACPQQPQPGAIVPHDRHHLAGSLRCVRPVPGQHAYVLLRRRSTRRRAACRLVRLQHSAGPHGNDERCLARRG